MRVQFHAAGRALQQNVEALADDADRRPEDHDADADGERRIDPALSGERDGDASGDDGGGGQRVADLVSSALRRLMSRWPRMSNSAMAPFITTPAAATQIMSCRHDIDRVQQAVEGFVQM